MAIMQRCGSWGIFEKKGRFSMACSPEIAYGQPASHRDKLFTILTDSVPPGAHHALEVLRLSVLVDTPSVP